MKIYYLTLDEALKKSKKKCSFGIECTCCGEDIYGGGLDYEGEAYYKIPIETGYRGKNGEMLTTYDNICEACIGPYGKEFFFDYKTRA